MGLKPATGTFNPFPGLRPFLPEESHLFFGREKESGEVLNKLLQNKFVTVIGASGCGKSSIINCGVLPGVKEFAGKDNMSLKIISFRPGNDPVGNLTDAFAHAISGNEDNKKGNKSVLTPPEGDSDWIASTVKSRLRKKGERVLMVVDQFEDIFEESLSESDLAWKDNAAKFVALLENAIKQTEVEIYIILALRSDFIGDCAHFPEFTQLINNSNYLVPQMITGNYKSIIEKPFLNSGAEIDPKLVYTLLEDIDNQAYSLCVLQHTMMRTYSFWQNLGDFTRPVDLSDYIAIGTIRGAISKHADEAFEELGQNGKEICRKMFLAITISGKANTGVRHPLSLGAIRSKIQCPDDELIEVIEKFRAPSRSFITPSYNVILNDNSTIDISNESLIRLWERLKVWVDEEISSIGTYRKLSEISAMFQKGKTTLLKNPELQGFINWRENQKPTLKWAERYDPAFERAMVYLRTSEKEYHEEVQIKTHIQRRRLKKNRIFTSVLGVAVIVSLGLMLFAFVLKVASDKQRSVAERQKAEAAAKVLLAEKNVLMAGKKLASADSSIAVASHDALEAIRQKEISDNQRSLALRDAEEARKQQSLAIEQSDSAKKASIIADMNARNATEQKNEAIRKRMISVGKSMSLKSLQLSGQKDLQTLLSYQAYVFNKSNGGFPNDADIYNGLYNVAKLHGNLSLKNYSGHEGEIKSIAFIPGKREFFTSGADGKVLKWDLDGKNQNLQIVYSGSDIINVLAVSPDAGWLACGGQNAGIKMIAVEGNKLSYDLKGHSGPVKSLIFSYDGKFLYSASLDGKVLKWDLNSKTSTNISGGMMQITAIDLSSDNKYIAGITTDGKVQVWNPDITTNNFRIESQGRVIRTVRFKPDESKIAIGYADGNLELWDITSRKKISEVKAHNSEVNDIRFNSKLSQIATAGNDKTIRLWDLNDMESLPVSFDDNKGFIVAIDFSSDGQIIVSGSTESNNNLMGRPTYTDILASAVRPVIGRNLTIEEWRAYIGKDIEYTKTIPDSEFKIRINVIK